MALPAPDTTRWRPLRLGLKNLYKYDDEEFLFAGGRLLLRGNNGTGKTRVLALTLPFLLDGEVRPSRVEPDASPDRRIEWHLLMDRWHERIGYAWIEFGRLDDGQPKFCTLGCGMRAVAGQPGLRRWFFVTTARIGQEFSLAEEDRSPIGLDRLKHALEGRGTIYETPSAYRRAVDSVLFGLGERRYAALVELLIELRRPQLSRKLEEGQLSAALSQALSSLDESTINDLSEAYSGLEQDRQQLQSVEASVGAIQAFNMVHRRHVAAHAKRFADDVRQKHHRYDSEQTAVREAQAAREAAIDELNQVQSNLEEAESLRIQAATTEMALRKSPEMKTAGKLAQLRQSAQAAAERSKQDAEDGKGLETAAASATEDANANLARVEEGRRALARAAAEVGAAGSQVGIMPTEEAAGISFPRLEGALESRRGAAKELKRFGVKISELRRRHESEQAGVRAAEEQRDSAVHAAGEADDRVRQARKEYLRALDAWLESLVECSLNAETARTSVHEWFETQQGGSPLEAAISLACDERLRVLAAQRAEADQSQRLLNNRINALGSEASQLEAGVDPVPPPPAHRDESSRAGRPGAPLWSVVDFKKDVSVSARAGYEAALQASGLLDAWISPDGTLRTEPDGDIYLQAQDSGPNAATLESVLVPSVDAAGSVSSLSSNCIRLILRAIGIGENGGHCWVSDDGRWRNGPARGAWSKSVAAFVGAGARAGARKVRLRAIATELEQLEAERATLIGQSNRIDAACDAVRAEQKRAPSDDAVRTGWALLVAEKMRLAKAQDDVSAKQRSLAAISASLERALGERQEFASDAGLSVWLDRDADLVEALASVSIAVSRLGDAIANHSRSREDLASARSRAKEAEVRAVAAAERSKKSSHAALALATELKTLESTQGAAVKAILEQLDKVVEEVRSAEKAKEVARARENFAREHLGAAKASESAAQGRLGEATSQRAESIRVLREVAAAGLLRVLNLAHEMPASSSPDTKVLELARALARDLKTVVADEKSLDQLQTQTSEALQSLQRALSSADMGPTAEIHSGIYDVRVPFQGISRNTAEVEALLGGEVAQRRKMLSAQERKVIETFLIDEAAAHLHDLIHDADRWVAMVNRELEGRPMSTGMALRFRWVVSDDAPQGADAARERLLRPSHAWSAEERQGLGDFLQQQIARSRERASTAAATWQEQLSEALDYRGWHKFVIERKNHLGKWWVPLTKKSHGTASGGEKAVALTMPQFAAAAAHYQSAPLAPRLILLDEAFVGIDNDMRRECMGLLAAFDLDVVMTSEREWGCYDTVPSLSIYQLAASNDCVATTRYVWDGKQRVRGAEPA